MNIQEQIKEQFGIKPLTFGGEKETKSCAAAYRGNPEWADEDDGIGSVNFTKTICEETARLIMLGTKVTFEGSRADYMQETIDENYYNLRQWIEYAMAYGTVVVRPDDGGYSCILPEGFRVTEIKNGEIWGAVFTDVRRTPGKEYTRLEYHRFEGDKYQISNRCYVRDTEKGGEDKAIAIEETPWDNLTEEVTLENVDRPLFAVIRTPQANNLDEQSPLGLPLVAHALQEIADLDVAYSRMTAEIAESKRTVLLDSDRLFASADAYRDKETQVSKLNTARRSMGLPDCVKAVQADADGKLIYEEINPTLNTANRLQGINHLLSQIGYKVGFANGYFVFNEQTGIQTATGVQANQQRTIQFIKDCRDRVEKAIGDLITSIAKFADLYDLAPAGDYKVNYQFGDITYNEEEDKARWLQYVAMGKVPFWYYLQKFEGFTEKDAKQLEQEAQPQVQAIFPGTEEE